MQAGGVRFQPGLKDAIDRSLGSLSPRREILGQTMMCRFYPACYTSAEHHRRGCHRQNDALASFSNFGTTCGPGGPA